MASTTPTTTLAASAKAKAKPTSAQTCGRCFSYLPQGATCWWCAGDDNHTHNHLSASPQQLKNFHSQKQHFQLTPSNPQSHLSLVTNRASTTPTTASAAPAKTREKPTSAQTCGKCSSYLRQGATCWRCEGEDKEERVEKDDEEERVPFNLGGKRKEKKERMREEREEEIVLQGKEKRR